MLYFENSWRRVDCVNLFKSRLYGGLLLIVFVCPLVCVGQGQLPDTSRIRIADNIWAKPGSYYLDLVEIDVKKVFQYLDFDNILYIKAIRGNDSAIFSGASRVFVITRKIKQPLIPLGYIAKGYTSDVPESFQFIIDDMLMADTAGVRIESSAIKKLEFLKYNGGHDAHGMNRTINVLITTGTGLNKKAQAK